MAHDDSEIMKALGRIEQKLEGLPERVAKLEIWRAWLTGAWAVITAGFLYIVKQK